MNSSLSGILMNSVANNTPVKTVWQAKSEWFLDKTPNIINVYYTGYLEAHLLDCCLFRN